MENTKVPLTMKINELAEYSGLSPFTIRQMVKNGELEHIRVGRVYYVLVDSLMKMVRSGENN